MLRKEKQFQEYQDFISHVWSFVCDCVGGGGAEYMQAHKQKSEPRLPLGIKIAFSPQSKGAESVSELCL